MPFFSLPVPGRAPTLLTWQTFCRQSLRAVLTCLLLVLRRYFDVLSYFFVLISHVSALGVRDLLFQILRAQLQFGDRVVRSSPMIMGSLESSLRTVLKEMKSAHITEQDIVHNSRLLMTSLLVLVNPLVSELTSGQGDRVSGAVGLSCVFVLLSFFSY